MLLKWAWDIIGMTWWSFMFRRIIFLFNVYCNQGDDISGGQKNNLYIWLIAENMDYLFKQPLAHLSHSRIRWIKYIQRNIIIWPKYNHVGVNFFLIWRVTKDACTTCFFFVIIITLSYVNASLLSFKCNVVKQNWTHVVLAFMSKKEDLNLNSPMVHKIDFSNTNW